MIVGCSQGCSLEDPSRTVPTAVVVGCDSSLEPELSACAEDSRDGGPVAGEQIHEGSLAVSSERGLHLADSGLESAQFSLEVSVDQLWGGWGEVGHDPHQGFLGWILEFYSYPKSA